MIGRSGTAICAQGANPGAIKRGRRLPYCLLLIAILVGAAILHRDGGAAFPTAKTRSNAQWAHLYGALPLSFEANSGQTDPSVKFLSRGQGYTLFLTNGEAVLTLRKSSAVGGPSSVGAKSPSSVAAGPAIKKSGREITDNAPSAHEAVLRMQLVGANSAPSVTGNDELPGKVNYFIGNVPSKWRTNVPTFARVNYENVYPGVDLVYYGTQGGELEYDFVVAPGADPQSIALGIASEAHAPLRIDSNGELLVALRDGDVRLRKPVVYQTLPDSWQRTALHGRRTAIDSRYALDAQNHVRFELGPYDHTRPLVIDPVLVYATYIGGNGGDVGYSIQVDATFDAYIAGSTVSTNFPTAGTPYQGASRGNGDGFVTKINTGGTQLIFSTYLGGSETDAITAMTLFNGSPFVTGYTNSPDFPTKSPIAGTNPFQMIYGGNTDAFVAELNTLGTVLEYSTYLGGSGADYGQGIAVNSAGNAYVTGSTQSANFPIISGGFQSSLVGSQNVFVTQVNFTGTALVYSTFLGGSSADTAQSIQLDSAGDAYLAGYTFSTNFPTVAPFQAANAGGADAFIAELGPAGAVLTFSTYLGGTGNDYAYGLALDSTSSPNIYITGGTSSTDFPTTSGAFQTSLNGDADAFVTKLNPSGSALAYSTYLGGSGVDQGTAIAVIPTGATNAGNVFVTGFTQSTDFPLASPIQSVLGLSANTLYCGSAPCSDAFVTQFNPGGSSLTFSTFLGGNGADFGQGIALDLTGDPYVTGSTDSTNFPAVSPPQYATVYVPPYKSALVGTAGNAFIAKMDPGNNPNISISPGTLNFGSQTVSVASPVQLINIVNPSTVPLVITQIQVQEVNNSTTIYTETDNCVGTISAGGAYCTMYVTFTPGALGTESTVITLTDNAGGEAGTQQTINLTGSGVTAATAVTIQPTSLSFTSTAVGASSAPQSVTITNTGTEPLTISKFSVGTSLDFTVTNPATGAPGNTCLALNDVLAVSQSCVVDVWFTPTASNTRSASLSISDNAVGSPQTVSLTGIGAAAFTLSSPSAVNPTIIGSDQTTFVLVANGPTSFTGAITLACSSGSTCAFSENPIFVGGAPSTLTISNLTTQLPNPYLFTVTGTSGSQSYPLQLSLGFTDFSLSASPSSYTTIAGHQAVYTIFVDPLNGFNQNVTLLCPPQKQMPPATGCIWSSTNTTPNGGPSSVTLTVTTQVYVTPPSYTHSPPRFPGGKLPPIIFGLLCLVGLTSLALGNRRRARHGWLGSGLLAARMGALSLIFALNLALATSCRSGTIVQSGTTTGGYTIELTGELTSNTTVLRYVTIALAVTAANPT
ncbi:MAG: SBBP repeat-containing protein [Terriglobia bacterium]